MPYFSAIYAKDHTVLPGIGRIHTHGVGNTRYTTGLDHYFLAEGAEKPVTGSVRFSAYVSEEGQIAWRFVHADGPMLRARHWKDPRITEDTQVDFPAEVVAEMRRLSETLQERDQTAWFFHALAAVDMELRGRTDKQADLARTISLLDGLLAKQSEPAQHFVSAEEAGTDKGYHRLATPEEKTARRLDWATRLAAKRDELETLTASQADRVAMLKRLYETLHDWSGQRSPKASPYDLYAQAIAA
jgi:hypothetical protein